MALWFVNAPSGLAGLADAIAGDVAIVLMNRFSFWGASGSPVVWTDLEKTLITPGDWVVGDAPDLFKVLTVDPSAPPDDTAWLVREGSPETVALKAQAHGVADTIAEFGPSS